MASNTTTNTDDKRHQDNLDTKTRSEIGQMGGEKRKEMSDEGKAMSYEDIGSKAHENGAHEFSSEEAKKAGKIGGQNSHSGGSTSDKDSDK